MDQTRTITYAGLIEEAGRFAAWARAAGFKAGDRVIIQLRKSIEDVADMFGTGRWGASS